MGSTAHAAQFQTIPGNTWTTVLSIAATPNVSRHYNVILLEEDVKVDYRFFLISFLLIPWLETGSFSRSKKFGNAWYQPIVWLQLKPPHQLSLEIVPA